MPVAPFSLLPHERIINRTCLAVVGATLVAAAIASVAAAPSERPRCRDHRKHVVALAPAEMTIVPPAPAVACTDPVAGTWVAREYRPAYLDWTEHELHITRAQDDYVVDHTSRVRDGDPNGPARFHCLPDAVEFDTVGRATLTGDQLRIQGDTLLTTRARCDGQTYTYSLDTFTGSVAGNTFDALNNDGNTAVDTPYRFTRISCE